MCSTGLIGNYGCSGWCTTACSYHAKELAAANQTSKRLQEVQLQHMQQELQLLEQQLDIEDAVRSTTVSFLNSKASSLQEATVGWHSRREEDAQNKEREVEVCLAQLSQSVGDSRSVEPDFGQRTLLHELRGCTLLEGRMATVQIRTLHGVLPPKGYPPGALLPARPARCSQHVTGGTCCTVNWPPVYIWRMVFCHHKDLSSSFLPSCRPCALRTTGH